MIRILVVLLAFSSPCFAEQGAPLSFVRYVGEYSFRIPSSAFFDQLQTQFYAKAVTETDVCKTNLDNLQGSWTFFDAVLQSIERQRLERPMAFIDLQYEWMRLDQLNSQNLRFVETEGMSVTTEAMRPKVLGQ